VLEIDEPSAEVVRRIFWAYVDGNGDRAIATILNEEGVPCPSARWPEQNRHRQADGWQGSTVRAIIDNPLRSYGSKYEQRARADVARSVASRR
jgi:hypothetical protein